VQRLQIESPHDKFFRFAFKQTELVHDLIQWTFPASLVKQVDFQLNILDLTNWTENPQETSPILTSTLQLLNYSRRSELINLLKEIFERWRDSLVSPSFKEWLQAAWNYVMSTNQDLSERQVQEIVDELLSVQCEPGSLVDRLYRQGHSERLTKGLAEGKTEGLAKGKAEGLANERKVDRATLI